MVVRLTKGLAMSEIPWRRDLVRKAEQLIEAFGHCTIVYECMTPKEVITEAMQNGSFVRWAELRFIAEEVNKDREAHGWDCTVDEHERRWAEFNLWMSECRVRVNAVLNT